MGDSVWRIENGTLCNSLDLICLSIWNFNGKFLQDRDEYYFKGGERRNTYFFNRHHNLNRVQAVKAQVLVKGSGGIQLAPQKVKWGCKLSKGCKVE